jgi:hypothetical protein
MEGHWQEHSLRGCEFRVEVGKVNEHVFKRMALARWERGSVCWEYGLESTTFTSHMMEVDGL